jgi:AraC-like DNA-binding protein
MRLQELFRRDLLIAWTAREAARMLGLSTRSLQRALQVEGVTFSSTLQRVRVDAAEVQLGDPRVSLTEVAFCTGFADHAHFTRTFRKLADVPPSAFRQVLAAAPGPDGLLDVRRPAPEGAPS